MARCKLCLIWTFLGSKWSLQEPAILAFSIPISILKLFQCLVDFDTDTDTRKSEYFDSDTDTDTKVKQILLHIFWWNAQNYWVGYLILVNIDSDSDTDTGNFPQIDTDTDTRISSITIREKQKAYLP